MSQSGAKGDLPYLQVMVAAVATQPKEDGVSDCTPYPSPDCPLDSRVFLVCWGSLGS